MTTGLVVENVAVTVELCCSGRMDDIVVYGIPVVGGFVVGSYEEPPPTVEPGTLNCTVGLAV